MEEQLKRYLEEFVSMLKEGGDIALQELPKFINEYLTYYTAYHGFWTLITFIVLALYATFWYKFNSRCNWDDDVLFGTSMVGAIICTITGIGFFENLFSFIKVTIVPRLYLVENLMDLVS